jgi:hypothetical protein
MGWGDFGSNGSVHWRLGYEDPPSGPPDHLDIDDTVKHPGNAASAKREIGTANGKNHRGLFRVTARFRNPEAAQAALQAAKVVGKTIVLDVPVRDWNAVSGGPGNPSDWEVRVDW